MNREEFKNTVNDLLKPLGFRKIGNYWKLETKEIEKVIELQKSNFSNLYYLNYSYNIINLNYNTVTQHIFNRLYQHSAFDLENNMIQSIRIEEIRKIFNNELIPKVAQINTELDIFELLKKRSHLHNIPLFVKEHLKLN